MHDWALSGENMATQLGEDLNRGAGPRESFTLLRIRPVIGSYHDRGVRVPSAVLVEEAVTRAALASTLRRES